MSQLRLNIKMVYPMESETNEVFNCSSCGCSIILRTPFCDTCSQYFQDNNQFFENYALYLELNIPNDWNTDDMMLAIYIREYNLALQVPIHQRNAYITNLRNGYFDFLNMFANMEIENDTSDTNMIISSE